MTESEISYSAAEVQELIEELEQSLQDRENLQSQISSQEQTIRSLSEQIEKLSGSDLELKKSEELRKNAEAKLRESERLREEAEASILSANAREREVRKKRDELGNKLDRVDSIIQERVDREAKRQAEESAQKLREATKEARTNISLPTYAIGLYSAVITLVWLVSQRDVLKTVPAWFVTRWEHIKILAGAVGRAFMWVHDLIPENWTETPRYLIPILIAGAVIYFGLYKGLYKALICRFKAWNADRWEKYSWRKEKERRKAFTAFLCAVSLFASVLICAYWKNSPLHFLTWYLIFSTVAYVAYHRKDSDSSSWY